MASQKLTLFAFDYSTGAPKTGDAANLTAYVSKDDGAVTVLGDTSAAELDATNAKGWYSFDLTQAETNADKLLFTAKSATANVSVVGLLLYTRAANINDLVIDGSGNLTANITGTLSTVTTLTGHTPQTGDAFARLGAPAGASVSADILAIDNLVDDLESRVGTPSNLGGGATLAANLSDIEAQTDDLGVGGAGLTAIPWNAAWDAEVQSEVDDALVARSLDKLVLASGTADSGSTTTLVDAALTQADADWWKGKLLVFTSGTLAGQTAWITDFNAGTDTLTFAPPTTAAVSTHTYVILPAASVWDDVLAEHLASGSTGSALNAAGSAGDPWATALPGAYGAGTAGKIVGDNLNATVSSRSSHSAADVWAAGTRTLTAATNITSTGGTITVSSGGVTLADGVTHGGTTAKLRLGSSNGTPAMHVTNSGGSAARFEATISDGSGIDATGAGVGAGMSLTGGSSSGIGLAMQSTSSSGYAMAAISSVGDAVLFSSLGGNGDGLVLAGHGSGHGLKSTGGSTGHGAVFTGGATSGDGARFVAATSGDGIDAVGAGGGADVNADIMGNITGTLSTVTTLTNLPAITANWLTAAGLAADAVAEIQSGLSTLTAGQVNAEVVDALATDTYAEPTGAPAATATLAAKLGYLHMALRNKLTVTASAKTFFDDGGAAEWSKALSDDGTTYTEAEGS